MRYIQEYDFDDHEDSEPLAVKIRIPKRHILRNILLISAGIIFLIAAGIFIYSEFIFDPLSPDLKNDYSPALIDFFLFVRKIF